MKTISVRQMKAEWSEIEHQVRNGETFEVLNHGKPAARIMPTLPRKVLKWESHLKTAVHCRGKSGLDAVMKGREGRW